VQHRAVLGDVDPLAGEHRVAAPGEVDLLGEPQQGGDDVVGDEVLGEVDVQVGQVEGELLGAVRVGLEPAAQVGALGVAVASRGVGGVGVGNLRGGLHDAQGVARDDVGVTLGRGNRGAGLLGMQVQGERAGGGQQGHGDGSGSDPGAHELRTRPNGATRRRTEGCGIALGLEGRGSHPRRGGADTSGVSVAA
jgi:hypothetical protein